MPADEANVHPGGGGGGDGVEIKGGNELMGKKVNGRGRRVDGFGVGSFVNLFTSSWGKIGSWSSNDRDSKGVKEDGNEDVFPGEEKKAMGDHLVGNDSDDGGMRSDRIEEAGMSEGLGSGVDGVDLVVDLNSCEKRSEGSEDERRNFALSLCGNNAGLGMKIDGKKNVKEARFVASDLVWGKVRSHPWWPGQIFEPWDASEEAKKHFKPNTYLVAYFGDQTFAWNEETKLKPFWPFFSQMSKQGDTEFFRTAVDCVLEEAYRRVEFAMSCRCIAEDTFDRIKTHIVENAGIREESSVREGGDRYFTSDSFEPAKFVPYVKALALLPDVELDKLEVVMARALLTAFYRKKGCYNMAEFTVSAPIFEDLAKSSDVDSPKHKPVSVDVIGSGKRQRRLADLLVEAGRQAGSPSGSSTTKKRKVDVSLNSNLEMKDKRRRKVSLDLMAEDSKHSSKVGESMRRIARKLSRASISDHCDSSSVEGSSGNTHAGSIKSQRKKKVFNEEHSSVDEMLSQLKLAAGDPLGGRICMDSIVAFFPDFRNSVAHEDPSHEGFGNMSNHISPSTVTEVSEGNIHRLKPKKKITSKRKHTGKVENGFEDPSWTDRIIGFPDSQAALDDKNEAEAVSTAPTIDVAPTTEGGERADGTSPTAMILNFSDPDSIPSEDRLNEIFSRYGSLLESETEVLRKSKRAKVVFTRVSDAETAFSSSGKFKTFGPSLNSYRLNYKPVLRKVPSAKSIHK